MKSKHLAQLALLMVLGACSTFVETPFDQLTDQETNDAVTEPEPLPENIVQLAAPYQDLTTARLDPADGCYWYLHRGPVETTWLPLRARDGRRICTRPVQTFG